MEIRAQQDAPLRAGIEIDMRVDARLADELQPGQPLDEGRADRGALPDQYQRFGVLQPLRERVDVLGVVVPDRDVVAGELGKALQRAHGILVVVEYRYFHRW